MNTLLKRDDQQPGVYIRGWRFLLYNIEEVLIVGVMGLELVSIYLQIVPIRVCLMAAVVLTLLLLVFGGI